MEINKKVGLLLNKIIIYFPYPIRDAGTGSAVRPLRILNAFREYANKNNFKLIEIFGDSKERKRRIKLLQSSMDWNDILFCYMENSTLPFWLTDKDHLPRTPLLEYNFFKHLKKNRIPLGLFYRDIYWKFDDLYPFKGIKRAIMRSVYYAERLIYKKYVSHFFLPSMEMNDYIKFPTEQTSTLPPGGEDLLEYWKKEKKEELNIIYVGCISERYGLVNMLQAVDMVYQKNLSVKLHLVCRIDEFNQNEEVFREYIQKPWLVIYHAYGDQLKKIYKDADVAIIPIRKIKYNDFAVPVKLFEYISYGLPVVATNCNAQAEIIRKDELGLIVDDSAEGLAQGLIFLKNEVNRDYYTKKVKEAIEHSHLWSHRVKEISILLKK